MCATKTKTVNATATATATVTPVSALLVAISNNNKSTMQGVFLQTANATFNAALPLTLGGVQAPQRAGALNNVWCMYLQLLVVQGAAPSVAQVLLALPNANANNTKIEFYRVAKWVAAIPAYLQAQQQLATPQATPQA